MDNQQDSAAGEFNLAQATPLSAADPALGERPARLIVDRLEALSLHETVSVGQIIEAFGRTCFLPMMLVPALFLVSPLSGIPLFSSSCGLWIVAVALQRLANRERLWLPGFIMRRSMQGARLGQAAQWLGRVADWLDRKARPRLHVLVTAPLNVFAYLLCILAGLTIPFLELVPFSSSILGLVVTLVVVGLLVRDGLFVTIAIGLAGVAASIPVFFVSQVVN